MILAGLVASLLIWAPVSNGLIPVVPCTDPEFQNQIQNPNQILVPGLQEFQISAAQLGNGRRLTYEFFRETRGDLGLIPDGFGVVNNRLATVTTIDDRFRLTGPQDSFADFDLVNGDFKVCLTRALYRFTGLVPTSEGSMGSAPQSYCTIISTSVSVSSSRCIGLKYSGVFVGNGADQPTTSGINSPNGSDLVTEVRAPTVDTPAPNSVPSARPHSSSASSPGCSLQLGGSTSLNPYPEWLWNFWLILMILSIILAVIARISLYGRRSQGRSKDRTS